MKIRIAYKLFLTILAATCLALLCMFLIMDWSIRTGFLRFLGAMEEGRLERMAQGLGQAYTEHGGWGFLRDDPRSWAGPLLNPQHPAFPPERFRETDRIGDGMRLPPPSEGRSGPRLIVLDKDRKALFGDPSRADTVNYRPVLHNNQIVGYVGVPRLLKPPLGPSQLHFLRQQKWALILGALGMALIVVTFSFPLAMRLVRPIRAMATATHDLASGKYAARVPVDSSDELGQLARAFNAMALVLEKNERARRQWVADISHELRTPLTVLRGETEALLDGIRSITPEAIRSLHGEALRLQRLVDDLYQLALSDLGALTYRKEEVSLAEVLGVSIENSRADFAGKNIMLNKDFSEGSTITVFADRERLNQLFANLLDNSLRYTDPGGKLIITLALQNGRVTVEFQDSAPGVPDQELGRLFDPLYRVEGSRSRASGGGGLGLAICRNIVEAHAGNITAHPSGLGGIRVRVTLPSVERVA
jgi:two-component system, OmpR family, sensor histidine kinase BaeS